MPVLAQEDTLKLSLDETIRLAKSQSADAAVAVNRLKTAYWEHRTHKADQLPEISFNGTLPAYSNRYSLYRQSDGTYTYAHENRLGLSGRMSVEQNIALTGGKITLASSLDFTRQLGIGSRNEYMSIPLSLTLVQPVFGTNHQKWKRRIEPLKYREAQSTFAENMEEVALAALSLFFNLLQSRENLDIALLNSDNANRLHYIAAEKRRLGYISESELMQLELNALQARGTVTEAQSTLNAARFRLGSFLGIADSITIEPLAPAAVPSLRIDYRDVLDKAVSNNSFSKNILRRQIEADYSVAAAKGEQRSVDLYASVGYTGKDPLPSAAYNRLSGNQIVEIGLSIPILDWGKRKGKVRVAESNREALIAQARQEQMTFDASIFLLVENFNNQAAQLDIAMQADRIASRRYAASIETFMTGNINVLDLNDARRSKDEAKIKLIAEMHKYWTYYFNIRSVALYDYAAQTFLTGN
ncbi:MAG: TolC family protein [Tannerellaceae bacterium]|jgi:outer membrane protein TolC|nr:TolC family protein [Tannerellaceae bacterium]